MPATPQYKVMLLEVVFKFEIERIGAEVGKIIKAIHRWAVPRTTRKAQVAIRRRRPSRERSS